VSLARQSAITVQRAETLSGLPTPSDSDPASSVVYADAVRQTGAVLTRSSGYLKPRTGKVPTASKDLESDGYTVLRGVFKPPAVGSLSADVERVFAQYPPDLRDPDDDVGQMAPFRYEMLNRSAPVQRAIGNPRILRTIEPLLGEDCHVISNTAWWQPPGNNEHLGRFWHIDAGPHVPRDPDIPWDPRIPYPIFAIAAHIFLRDCPLEAGPTAVIPRSHTSGQPPPFDHWPIRTWSGTAAVRYPWLPKQAMSRSSSPTSGTRGCRRPATILEGCSSNAITGGVTSRSASDRPRRCTNSARMRCAEPGPPGSRHWSDTTHQASTTAEEDPRFPDC
jgi:hypothetical protein